MFCTARSLARSQPMAHDNRAVLAIFPFVWHHIAIIVFEFYMIETQNKNGADGSTFCPVHAALKKTLENTENQQKT